MPQMFVSFELQPRLVHVMLLTLCQEPARHDEGRHDAFQWHMQMQLSDQLSDHQTILLSDTANADSTEVRQWYVLSMWGTGDFSRPGSRKALPPKRIVLCIPDIGETTIYGRCTRSLSDLQRLY